MRTIDMIKASVEAESEAMGFILAAILDSRPSTVEELEHLMGRIRLKVKARDSSGVVDHQVFYAALSLSKGIKAFKNGDQADFSKDQVTGSAI